MGAVMVCVKAHTNPAFGEVPVDSRWDVDDPIVAAKPKSFRRIDEPDEPVEPDDVATGDLEPEVVDNTE